ncbi:Hypothetical_protein [Hexamita inflata]|uniref:Hypothetical_protein n=1 Tax=Hexamita inflata TaxID=28002 RepID=A0AA86TQ62_9EUKA|nr:Hypothetical protein HINF_LOCUS10307 [Hexamita inflata]
MHSSIPLIQCQLCTQHEFIIRAGSFISTRKFLNNAKIVDDQQYYQSTEVVIAVFKFCWFQNYNLQFSSASSLSVLLSEVLSISAYNYLKLVSSKLEVHLVGSIWKSVCRNNSVVILSFQWIKVSVSSILTIC